MIGQFGGQEVFDPAHVDVPGGEIAHELEVSGFDGSQLIDFHATESENSDFEVMSEVSVACQRWISFNEPLCFLGGCLEIGGREMEKKKMKNESFICHDHFYSQSNLA